MKRRKRRAKRFKKEEEENKKGKEYKKISRLRKQGTVVIRNSIHGPRSSLEIWRKELEKQTFIQEKAKPKPTLGMRPWEALGEESRVSEAEPCWTQGKSPAQKLPQACEIQEHLVTAVLDS